MMDQKTQNHREPTARQRFARLMLVMVAATVLVLIGAFTWLHSTNTPMPFHFIAAVSLAVVGSMMLAAILMGLIFFSSASGRDSNQDPHDPNRK